MSKLSRLLSLGFLVKLLPYNKHLADYNNPSATAAAAGLAASSPHSLTVLSLLSYCVAVALGTCSRVLVLVLVRPFSRAADYRARRRRRSSSPGTSPLPSPVASSVPLSSRPRSTSSATSWSSKGMGMGRLDDYHHHHRHHHHHHSNSLHQLPRQQQQQHLLPSEKNHPGSDKQGEKTMLRRYLHRRRRRNWWFVPPPWVLVVLALLALEVFLHNQASAVPRPDENEDPPFQTGCREPDVDAPRENAALVMLARNSERHEAQASIASVERHFNRWFHYPVVFLNDEPWDDDFIETLNATVSGGASFEVIPKGQWGFPEWMDETAARESMAEQGAAGIKYAGKETYHHMCRFFSGNFYTLDALKKYKWYWRIEPDVDFSCAITYDPFVEMARHKKTYGFTISLWEEWATVPSLFRETSDWKEALEIPTNNLWRAMVSPSWVPWPLRSMMSLLPYRDVHGDVWSGCHYWSNFEIADLDFFRSRAYQDYYKYLDRRGGFYFERWGDAAVHSLAIGMLLRPDQVHHFEDFGYRHDTLYECPANAPGRQLPNSAALGNEPYAPELPGGSGCRCECDGRVRRNQDSYCVNRLKSPNTPRSSIFGLL